MAIRPDMVAYIRTMVRGEHAANDEIEARLDLEGWEGFSTLLGAVFYFAVNRRFPGGASQDEIIRFVSEMRSTTIGGPRDRPEQRGEVGQRRPRPEPRHGHRTRASQCGMSKV